MNYNDIDTRRKPISLSKTWLSKLALMLHISRHRKNIEEVDNHAEPPVWVWEPLESPALVGEPHPQQQSSLFSLPLEIRQTIYGYVFGPSMIHIESLGDRLTHVACQEWREDESGEGHPHWNRGTGEVGTVALEALTEPNDHLLALLLGCRQA